ncbi:hypothetical protein TNCV_3239911 [Trichonephila clavipes]|nr:hypothetical protein TNCV_3239911 [Trichonephila clavipes]
MEHSLKTTVLRQVKLASLYPANREVTGAISTPISGFKVYRVRSDWDQDPNSNPGYAQTEMILNHVSLLWG